MISSTPIAPPSPEATFYEIKPALLNLVMKKQFSGVSTNDAAAHLNNFVKLCEMQKYKDVDGDIIKLKLFPFSLRRRAKDWLLSLPRNCIDSWVKCKDAFIGKYYPPAKIISLRSDIMKFKQFDNEHVAQAWERMKSLIKNCPTYGLTTWMIIQTFYAGLNFSLRNLLDSAAGGTFISIILVENGSLVQHQNDICPGLFCQWGPMTGVGPGSCRQVVGPGSFRSIGPGLWHQPGPIP
jgi:hypothetical protein